jgi:hypothetical protein
LAYRNKTYVAFASEDITSYHLMEAWKANKHIDFNFFDAHDLNVALDTSQPETIKRRLRERLANTKQAVLLGSPDARRKGGDGKSFLDFEVKALLEMEIPIVIANLDGGRTVKRANIPEAICSSNQYTLCVSFQPAIIKKALDDFIERFPEDNKTKSGLYEYKASVYDSLGL